MRFAAGRSGVGNLFGFTGKPPHSTTGQLATRDGETHRAAPYGFVVHVVVRSSL
jgi:hypothetical protein